MIVTRRVVILQVPINVDFSFEMSAAPVDFRRLVVHNHVLTRSTTCVAMKAKTPVSFTYSMSFETIRGGSTQAWGRVRVLTAIVACSVLVRALGISPLKGPSVPRTLALRTVGSILSSISPIS